MSDSVDWPAVRQAARQTIEAWHRDLAKDRHDRARLRRAQTIDDVFEIDAYHRLRLRLTEKASQPWIRDGRHAEVIARIALALAEIKSDQTAAAESAPETDLFLTLGAALGRLSPERLRLLANTGEIDLFLRLLRGALAQVERTAPVWDTAETVRRWHFAEQRQFARRDLLIRYHDRKNQSDEKSNEPVE